MQIADCSLQESHELNAAKTAVWSPAGRSAVDRALVSNWLDKLPVLGTHLRAQGDSDEAAHLLGHGSNGLPEATQRLRKLWSGLQELLGAGLKRQAAAALLRTYAGAASQHALQLTHATEADALHYDSTLKAAWESLAGRTLDDTASKRLGVPAKRRRRALGCYETARRLLGWLDCAGVRSAR